MSGDLQLVLLFPGQGSQRPGMGRDLADALPEARRVFEAADRTLGTSLSGLCFDGPAEELTLTHNAQPALLVHGAAVWASVCDAVGSSVVAAAGHSLGEFTAYHAAGALTLEDAVRLVRRRGELMLESGRRRQGAMAAILGEPARPIEEICAEASREGSTVVAANYNSPGQVVISGEPAGVDRAMELAKAAGAKRAVRLNVSGAFHSPLMADAQAEFGTALASARFRDPAFPVYSNVNAEPVHREEMAPRLLEQLTAPVRWTEEIESMAQWFPKATYVEMGPGNVLTGLVRKIAPDVETMTCGTAAEVRQLLERAA